MAEFLKGLRDKAVWPRSQRLIQLTPEQIHAASNDYMVNVIYRRNQAMADIIDDIQQVLKEHNQAITVIEGFLDQHAKKAANAVDPIKLQAVVEEIRIQTAKLSALMQKYPIVP